MPHYNKHSINAYNSDNLAKMTRDVREGVFETPQGKFVVRIMTNDFFKIKTISQHNTFKEAENKYNEIKNQ